MFTCGFTFEEIKKISDRKYDDWSLALDEIEDLFNEENNWGIAASRRLITNVDYYFICLKKRFDFSDKSHTKLAHEVLHVISFNLKHLMDTMEENESFCYTHTHVMDQCYKILRS